MSTLVALFFFFLSASAHAQSYQYQFSSHFDFWELPLESVLNLVVTAGNDSGNQTISFGNLDDSRAASTFTQLQLELLRRPAEIFVINGMQIDPREVSAWISDLPFRWIKRIEYLTGNSTLLWGEEIRNGVVVIELWESQELNKFSDPQEVI